MRKSIYFVSVLLFSLTLTAETLRSESLVETVFVKMGSGSMTGLYYPTGNAIAKLVNAKRREYGLRITVETTTGSVFNVNAVLKGEMEFGLVQADRQYQAVNGLAEWKEKGEQTDLRAVLSLYQESLTLIAGADSGIRTIQDVKGKNINIGYPGSGHRQNAIDVLTAVGLDFTRDINPEGIKVSDAIDLFEARLIDAFFYTVGHPSEAIREVSSGKRAVWFVPITGVDALLKRHPYYSQSIIPMKHYPGAKNSQDIPTIGVKATLIARAQTPAKIVYAVTKEVFENLKSLKELHPAYSDLTPASMLEGLSAPIHEGARRYYREAGLSP